MVSLAVTPNGKDRDISNPTLLPLDFTPVKGRNVQVVFDEPAVTSDAGALFVHQALVRSPLVAEIAAILDAEHDRKRSCKHPIINVLRQRIALICNGYFKADDSDKLRHDPAFVLAAGGIPGEDALASQPTVSRLENGLSPRVLLKIGRALVDDYLRSLAGAAPQMIVLDMDPTAITTYGTQQMSLFNAYEDEYCLMPFHVYDGVSGRLITAVMRPGKTPTSTEILCLLRRLVKRIRAAFPEVRITFRADSHHTKPEVMAWMESAGVHLDYITGLSPNARLNSQFRHVSEAAKAEYKRTLQTVERHADGYYAAATWGGKLRRVVCRVIASSQGVDTRYVVTSFKSSTAKHIYESVYCGRGRAELMIKDHKLDLGSGHASGHAIATNQFRLFLHSVAYNLLHTIRKGLPDKELSCARFSTIRLKLLKIGARVEVKARSIRFHLPASYPLQGVFAGLVAALRAAPS
jgi:hypothetical protein